LNFLFKVKSKIGRLVRRFTFSPIKYWEERAKNYGELSVLNLSLNEDEIKSLKEFQASTIFPFLKRELTGEEHKLLDFGCGPGRLSVELSELTKCEVLGVDPIEHLLELAPFHPDVSYQKTDKNIIPAPDNTFDIIWISFVLGGIVNKRDFNKTLKELDRVLNKNGLLFLVENTSDQKNALHWKYYTKDHYIRLFQHLNLVHVHDFIHGNEQFSIFTGRKTLI